MKTSLYCLVFLFAVFMLTDCKEADFTVTYEVWKYQGNPHRLYISYCDSVGKRDTVVSRNWKKTVRLSARQVATLMVYPLDPEPVKVDKGLLILSDQVEYNKLMQGRITYRDKTVREISQSVVLLDLGYEEARERK